MPAYTVAQLESLLGSYVEPSGDFTAALAQVLPRIYAMGMWRDLTFEDSYDASLGYISLPSDAESVIACTVDDNESPVQSLWTDVRFAGRNPILSPYFGIVDDGFHPVSLDMKEVQGVESEDDVVAVTDNTLYARYSGRTDAVIESSFTGTITIVAAREDGGSITLVQEASVDDELIFTGSAPFNKIYEITYTGTLTAVDIIDGNYGDKIIATIPAGSGVLRFRRFRTTKEPNSVVHLLMKRACPTFLTDGTVIHLGNLNALKHGLLARIAEDNSDLQRADIHWAVCEKLLDAELDAYRGQAKPRLVVNGWGVREGAPYNIL